MNIVTIATEGEWVDIHAARWLRYVRKHVPDAVTCLILAGQSQELLHPNHPVVGAFDKVRVFPMREFDRPWCNRVRLEALDLFELDECLYLDCDADVLGDLSPIPAFSDKPLLWVRSPVIHQEWFNVCQRKGVGAPKLEANNCLLYMRQTFVAEYDKAAAEVDTLDVHPRIRGTIAFNVMLLNNPDASAMLPDIYGSVRGEGRTEDGKDYMLKAAVVVQYCADRGKQKREELEALWLASQSG